MNDIIKRKNWYFALSLLIIIPGIISLFLYGLNLSIDYTGGTRITLLFPKTVTAKTEQDIRATLTEEHLRLDSLQTNGKEIIFRTLPIPEKQNLQLTTALQKKLGSFKAEDFETVGPVIGSETTGNALKALL